MRCLNCNSLQIHVIDLKPKPKDKIIIDGFLLKHILLSTIRFIHIL
jgi:hypothetical protein